MTVAIIGSRSLSIPIPDGIIPENTSLILSGGAIGIDRCAREYALSHRILIEEIIPAYDIYGRRAPLVRNDVIVSKSDMVYIFWDGKSSGTAYVINQCRKQNKPFRIFTPCNNTYKEISL